MLYFFIAELRLASRTDLLARFTVNDLRVDLVRCYPTWSFKYFLDFTAALRSTTIAATPVTRGPQSLTSFRAF
ncbi:hypothetical protein JTE90_015838 [Oedothorax gibbosus]|uniref:Uncharacterized protein n=1 Tax=Oedothorax gibbosus TaxID=931172 RepID=A0AAV6VTK7_9ARAC|nr:hypothetical protein JTE90_015838 [Oedothorax gibbosus]